jgi:hypothetical protein
MHVSPTEAAKNARRLVRQLREKVNGPAAPANMAVQSQIADALIHLKEILSRIQRIEDQLPAARAAASQRRARPTLDALSAIAVQANRIKRDAGQARELIDYATANMASPPSQASLRKLVDDLHIQIQAIPTYEGALLTPAESILHAIYVVMRNNGYLKEQGNGTE